MRRLLVLSSLAVAILTIPALAGTPEVRSPLTTIGFVIAGTDGDDAAAYWTPERLAAAPELPLPLIPGTPDGLATS